MPWVAVTTVSVPSGSVHAVAACGSTYAWYTQLVVNVASTVASESARAALASPST
jgi:hypothetical protein